MPTTSNGDCCVELMQGTLVRPIARYPASVAFDDSLKVAANRVRTSLVRNVGPGDTLLTVSDASRIVPQMLLSIDSEIVSVSAISDNILTVVRGFDGTQSACHSAGSVLNANITAFHHNALAAEITAIEQALGPNLSNIGGTTGTVGPFLLASTYNFVPQSPGGTLSPGSNVIALSPVPQGVNGSNTGYKVWISGGTGAAEAAQVTGGTAVAGAPSGTLIVTCANAHSGSWTIGSSSGGIQEAVCSLPTNGGVVLVASDVVLHADVTKAGKAQPMVWKLAGSQITGNFNVLEATPDSGLPDWTTGPHTYYINITNGKVCGLSIYPEGHDPWPASYGSAVGISQADPAKITMNQFFHGVSVDMHTGNPFGSGNQNAAVLGFLYSHGGADPFGGDLHGIVPAGAVAPSFCVGVQATTQCDIAAPGTNIWPLLLTHSSTVGRKASSMILLGAATSGSRFLMLNDLTNNPFTDEGIVLIPADDLNPFYRAYALSNSANTEPRFYVMKNGSGYFHSPVVAQAYNYVASETGAANAIAGTFQNLNVPALVAGLTVTVQCQHGLQAGGANTFNLNGTGPKAIKSHYNRNLDIAQGYNVGSMITLLYDGGVWQDMSQ